MMSWLRKLFFDRRARDEAQQHERRTTVKVTKQEADARLNAAMARLTKALADDKAQRSN